MAEAAGTRQMTAAEYLAWERQQEERYEFHLGEVFLMLGGSARHAFLAARCVTELSNRLPQDCKVMTSDLRVAASPGSHYVYADAVAVCGEIEIAEGTNDVLANPCVVVEVLSPSTEKFDRGEKWEAYQRLEHLRDYLLVSQRAQRVEHYRRAGDTWRYQALTGGDEVQLADGTRLPVDALYRGAFDLPGA